MKHIKYFEEINNNDHDIEVIINSYLSTAIWSGSGNDDDSNLDDKSIYDFDDKSRPEIKDEIEWFVAIANDYLEDLSDDQIGHDLWLTRNGHGSGFFDVIEDKSNLEAIDELCKILGDAYIFVDVDDKIYYESNTRYKELNVIEYKKQKKFEKDTKKFNL